MAYHPGTMDWLNIDRHRLGTGLLAFGILGVVLAGLIAVALAGGAIAARNLDERLVADQNRIAASLTRLTLTMETLAVSTEHAGDTLTTSRDAMTHASELLGDLSATSAELATALDIEILGKRPFASAVESVQEVARTLAVFEQDAVAVAAALDENTTDVAGMANEIRAVKGQVSGLAGAVAGFDRIDQMVGLLIGGIVLGALLTVWVAVAAAGCAWVGWQIRKATRTPGANPVEPAA